MLPFFGKVDWPTKLFPGLGWSSFIQNQATGAKTEIGEASAPVNDHTVRLQLSQALLN